MSNQHPPLYVPEAYRFSLATRGAFGVCLFIGTLALIYLMVALGDDWSSFGIRMLLQMTAFLLIGSSANHLLPCTYVFDEDGIWRLNSYGSPDAVRFGPSRRWWQNRKYQREAKHLIRPSQVMRWQALRWRGYPTIVITLRDHEQVTLCMRHDFPGSSKEKEVRKRLREWVTHPQEDEYAFDIHWDEVPEEVKPWI